MNIEEKAKAYDEALERARKQRDDYQKEFNKTADKSSQLAEVLRAGICAIELAFPQLAESEDEKIIRLLRELGSLDAAQELYEEFNLSYTDVLYWLEKQKECLADNNKTSENDDERIRKQLIDAIKIGCSNSGISFTQEAASRYIAWLEKHNEEEIKKIRNEEYTNGFNDAAGFGKQKDLTTVTIPL